jgi:hypothetical protein
MTLFHGRFSAPSWQSLTYLAYGWSLAWGRQTITTSLWLRGATTVKHFWRYDGFLGGPLYTGRDRWWAQVIRCGASCIPDGEVMPLHVDDHTAKKSGRHIQGRARSRNGAGSARQEYRILAGINLGLGIRRIPLSRWLGHALSLPIGLALSLNPPLAHTLGVPSRSRSQLASHLVDLAAEQLPGRPLRVSGDGECATQAFLRNLPPWVEVVGRLLRSANLDQPAPQRPKGPRETPRKKGDGIGSPQPLAKPPTGWQPPHRSGRRGAELVWHMA